MVSAAVEEIFLCSRSPDCKTEAAAALRNSGNGLLPFFQNQNPTTPNWVCQTGPRFQPNPLASLCPQPKQINQALRRLFTGERFLGRRAVNHGEEPSSRQLRSILQISSHRNQGGRLPSAPGAARQGAGVTFKRAGCPRQINSHFAHKAHLTQRLYYNPPFLQLQSCKRGTRKTRAPDSAAKRQIPPSDRPAPPRGALPRGELQSPFPASSAGKSREDLRPQRWSYKLPGFKRNILKLVQKKTPKPNQVQFRSTERTPNSCERRRP